MKVSRITKGIGSKSVTQTYWVSSDTQLSESQSIEIDMAEWDIKLSHWITEDGEARSSKWLWLKDDLPEEDQEKETEAKAPVETLPAPKVRRKK